MKICSKCSLSKRLKDFHKDRTQKDGHQASCRECRRNNRGKDLCPDCGGPKTKIALRCVVCNKGPGHQKWKTGRSKLAAGYILVSGFSDHPNAVHRGRILEHVLVMSEHLGRPLLKNESVHHKNGIRDDNRLENLELWAVSQPAGQRVEDLLAWAHEIIERYET